MIPRMLLSSVAKPAKSGCGVAFIRNAMMSSLPIGASTTFSKAFGGLSNNITQSQTTIVAHGRRCVSTTPPFMSSSGGGGNADGEGGNDDKDEIIQRWMKWNTSKTFKYKPNMDLIANIGKEGTKSPLDQFRDVVPREKREAEPVGRSWTVKELRRKSYEDLHKLWYVLYKERNMLLTEANLARRHGYFMVQPERRQKIRKSMGAIKHVLGERKRKKIAEHKQYLEEVARLGGLVANVNLHDKEIEEAMHTEAKNLDSKDP